MNPTEELKQILKECTWPEPPEMEALLFDGEHMVLMPNNHSFSFWLERWYPDRMGNLYSPDGLRRPKGSLPWALDNGMYGAWKQSGFSNEPYEVLEHWDSWQWLSVLPWTLHQRTRPQWIVAPDMPGNALETLRLFDHWRDKLSPHWRLAIAVQDGMKPRDVPEGVVCFLGGSTEWKWNNLERFCAECWHTHVARVNTGEQMWKCDRAGAKSVDGSGWFRGDRKQLRGILRYLMRSSEGMPESDTVQMMMTF